MTYLEQAELLAEDARPRLALQVRLVVLERVAVQVVRDVRLVRARETRLVVVGVARRASTRETAPHSRSTDDAAHGIGRAITQFSHRRPE